MHVQRAKNAKNPAPDGPCKPESLKTSRHPAVNRHPMGKGVGKGVGKNSSLLMWLVPCAWIRTVVAAKTPPLFKASLIVANVIKECFNVTH
jgi:hypothetical protein